MKMPPRSRLLPLLGIGMALLAVTALWVRQQQGAFRGADYYFPAWRTSEGFNSRADGRLEELTDLRHSLPIVLAAWERTPSSVGIKWEEIREKLPESFQGKLPVYSPDWNAPLDWLSSRAHEVEIAKAITNRWFSWTEAYQRAWLEYQSPTLLTNRVEYLPLLSATIQGTNSPAAEDAARLLAAYRPMTPESARLIAWAMTNHGRVMELSGIDPLDSRLVRQLATLYPAPQPIVGALLAWSISTNREFATVAALTLSRMAPDEFPAAGALEPGWRLLSPRAGDRFVSLLGRGEFRPVATSSWGIGIFKELLNSQFGPEGGQTVLSHPPIKTILVVLSRLDSVAGKCVPDLLPLLSSTNSQVSQAAAVAFAALAPPAMELVPTIIPHLTNEAAAAPLLLWLTSLGTNAVAASGAVYGLARETTRFPTVSWSGASKMDPVLAQRYGLIPKGTSLHRPTIEAERARANWLKPSEIKVSAPDHCPRALVRFWPGFERTHMLMTNQAPNSSEEVQTRLLLAKLPRSNLAELARRCLASIAAGNPAWQLPLDSGSQ